MTFLAPLTLLGLFSVALPVVIHLLARRRGRRLDFPSLEFLRETPSFKLRPRRIRQPLLLALRAAAIILLILGLARPLLTLHRQTRSMVHFIMIDASLSMKARGREDAAKEQARSLINQLKAGERACVISFSSEARVLANTSADKPRLLEAVEGYRAEGGTADYSVGFAEISRQLHHEPQADAEADIISDFQVAGFNREKEPIIKNTASRIMTYPIGSELESNAFLIDEDVRKTERGLELSATEIVSKGDGREGARNTWTLEGSAGERAGLEWRTENNGQMTGRLSALEPDDFDSDDERFFAFQPPRDARVLLVEDSGEATLFLRAAIASAGEGEEKVALDRRGVLPGGAAELASYSLVVVTLHGAPRVDQLRALAEYARAGGNVWLLLARDLDTQSLNAFVGSEESGLPFKSISRISEKSLSFGAVDADAPVFRGLDESVLKALRAVRVRDGYSLEAQDTAETIMRWNDGSPVFISERTGTGNIMLLATSPERVSSELGASPVFPALASSILRASVSPNEALSRTIGEPLRLDVAPDVSVKMTSMEGRAIEAKARELFTHPLAYINEPGIYRFEVPGHQSKFIAFNSPAEESERMLAAENDLKQRFSVEEKSRTVSESNWRAATEGNGSLWRYFLAAAFLLLVSELFFSTRQRRVTEAIE